MSNLKTAARCAVAALGISATCLVSIATFEGYKGKAYKDVVGVPTLGFGETKNVKMGDTTTPERALVRLLTSAEEHADRIRKCIKVPLYQHEFDAYVSFGVNIGTNAFCKSTLVKKLNKGDYAGACAELKRWNKADGKVFPGLVNRRQKEYEMCMGMSK